MANPIPDLTIKFDKQASHFRLKSSDDILPRKVHQPTQSMEQNFRDSLRAFNNRNTDETQETLLGSFQARAAGMMDSLSFQSNPDNECCGLTRMQRYLGFFMMLGTGLFCFFLSLFFLPMVIIAPGKFALTFTTGSLLFLFSWSVLNGFMAHMKALISYDRIAFTMSYMGSMVLNLYFTVVNPKYVMIILCTIIQMIALAWYLASYLPGGVQGMRWVSRSVGLPV